MSLKDLELVYDRNLDKWIYVNNLTQEIFLSNKKIIANRYLRNGFYPQEYSFLFKKKLDTIQCSYCGDFVSTREITRDHSWPKSLGGVITTPSCDSCNTIKRNTKPIQWAIESSSSGLAFGKTEAAKGFAVFEEKTDDGYS